MWNTLSAMLDARRTVEYAILQLDTCENTKVWRRHDCSEDFRFECLRHALFNEQGARSAILGTAPWPHRYARGDRVLVPYVATWLDNEDYGYLIRASVPEPEAVVVNVCELNAIHNTSVGELLTRLATVFGGGAENFGVRHIAQARIVELR